MNEVVRRCSVTAVARRCSVKKAFLEISQNSQENTCVRVSFFVKKETLAQVFSYIFCEISNKNTCFTEHLRTTASCCVILVGLLCVNCLLEPSTDVAETSILGVAGVLDTHLIIAWCHNLSRSLLSGVSSYKVSGHLWWSWHWLAARDCFVLSGELQPRCSRSPSAAFGKELRIMNCECFHLINVSNCLATAWIYYGALCDASWQMVFDNCCHREPYLRCCMSSRLIEMET